jgi:xanthine/uracil permease
MINRLELGNREVLVLAISLGVAFGIPSQEALVASLPSFLQGVFKSPVAAGGITAVIMSLLYLPPVKAGHNPTPTTN